MVQELHWDSAKSHAGWRARGGTASSQCPHNAEGLRPLQDARRATSHGLTLLCLWGHGGHASCALCHCAPSHRLQTPLWSLESHSTAPVPAPRHHPGVPKAGVTWLSPRPHLSLPACQPLVALPLADVVWVPCLEGVPLHGALPQARLPAQPAPQPPTGALWGQRVGSGGNGGCSTITPPSPVSTLTHACKHVRMTCAHMCALTVLHTYRRTKGCTHLCSHSRAHRCAHSAVGTRMQMYTYTHARSHRCALTRAHAQLRAHTLASIFRLSKLFSSFSSLPAHRAEQPSVPCHGVGRGQGSGGSPGCRGGPGARRGSGAGAVSCSLGPSRRAAGTRRAAAGKAAKNNPTVSGAAKPPGDAAAGRGEQ